VELEGVLISSRGLRYTPAGIPVFEGVLAHRSTQTEAGAERRIEFEVGIKSLGECGLRLAELPLGAVIHCTGFLAARTLKSRTPILHITELRHMKGKEHG
jgi:primosomal replication protein N